MMDYSDRLKYLKLQRLEVRCIHFDLVTAYNILHGFYMSSLKECFILVKNNFCTRGHSHKLYTVC
jgi:hypothetical protein